VAWRDLASKLRPAVDTSNHAADIPFCSSVEIVGDDWCTHTSAEMQRQKGRRGRTMIKRHLDAACRCQPEHGDEVNLGE
jgi:hypothetical protein